MMPFSGIEWAVLAGWLVVSGSAVVWAWRRETQRDTGRDATGDVTGDRHPSIDSD